LLASWPPFRAGVPVGINDPPVWSPDGKKIAMSTRHNGTWVVNADGTGLRRLTAYSGDSVGGSQWQRPAWRPHR
jgi:Tol biopolymer transport system component